MAVPVSMDLVRRVAGMLLLAVMWSLSIPITKLVLETVPRLTTIWFAVVVPLLFLFSIGPPRRQWRALPRAAALGMLGIGLVEMAQAFGIAGIGATVGTIISTAIPLFVACSPRRALDSASPAISNWISQ